MTLEDFTQHIPIIQDELFEIEPMPDGIDRAHRLFKLDSNDYTHAKLLDDTGKLIYLSLNAIEFINPGNPATIVTYRKMRLQNQSFV